MHTLHVRSVPEELYNELQSLAQAKHRSLSAQIVDLLYSALENERRRQKQGKILEMIHRRRFMPPPNTPDSTELLREDRNR